MQMSLRTAAALGLLGLCACASTAGAAPAPAPASAAPASPLSARAYSVGSLCTGPSPGRARCLGLRLIARAPLAVPHARAVAGASEQPGPNGPAVEFKEPIPGSLTPANLVSAYGLPATPAAGATQTIAIVDAYDDANVEADLEHYDKQFGLSACTEANGCFRKVNQEGH